MYTDNYMYNVDGIISAVFTCLLAILDFPAAIYKQINGINNCEVVFKPKPKNVCVVVISYIVHICLNHKLPLRKKNGRY